MAKLIYSAITSLDGYVEDAEGKFDRAAPGDELFAVVNDLERPIGIHLYGRRMYETMIFWETVGTGEEQTVVMRDFAEIWLAAEKIVYSRTLQTVSSARTRIEPDFEIGAIRRLKQTSGPDITICGAELAGRAIRSGLVATSAICSSRRSSWVAASPHSLRTSGRRSSSSTNAASRAAPSTSTTA